MYIAAQAERLQDSTGDSICTDLKVAAFYVAVVLFRTWPNYTILFYVVVFVGGRGGIRVHRFTKSKFKDKFRSFFMQKGGICVASGRFRRPKSVELIWCLCRCISALKTIKNAFQNLFYKPMFGCFVTTGVSFRSLSFATLCYGVAGNVTFLYGSKNTLLSQRTVVSWEQIKRFWQTLSRRERNRTFQK